MNKKINRMICEHYTTDKNDDVSLWSFIIQTICKFLDFIIQLVTVMVICISIVAVLIVIFLLPGSIVQCVLERTLEAQITYMTPVISVIVYTFTIGFVLFLKWCANVKVAHCDVRKEKKTKVIKEEYCGESSRKKLSSPCKYSDACEFTKCQNHKENFPKRPRDQWWGYTD